MLGDEVVVAVVAGRVREHDGVVAGDEAPEHHDRLVGSVIDGEHLDVAQADNSSHVRVALVSTGSSGALAVVGTADSWSPCAAPGGPSATPSQPDPTQIRSARIPTAPDRLTSFLGRWIVSELVIGATCAVDAGSGPTFASGAGQWA